MPWYQWVRPGALYFVGMIPAVWTFYLGVADQLGADPMKALCPATVIAFGLTPAGIWCTSRAHSQRSASTKRDGISSRRK